LHIEIDYSLTSNRIIWVLNHLINKKGKPTYIRMDNGPEFIAHLTANWSIMQGINQIYSARETYYKCIYRTFQWKLLKRRSQ